MKMLKISDLSVKLGNFELRNISFDVAAAEYFVLLGMSGSGKSVLLNLIGGLINWQKGEIVLNGRDISREKIQKRGVGLVFQDSALFPHMNVCQNIAYPLRSAGTGRRETEARVTELAGITHVSDLLKRMPANLSGGERQRVALARALALGPELLMLDEPLSSLDVQMRSDLRSLLREINLKGQTIVHVTHDYEEAALLADRIGVIEKGTVVQTGKPSEVFQNPRSEFVARFVGVKNFIGGRLQGGNTTLRNFSGGRLQLRLLTDDLPGEGFVIIRAEDITILSEMPSSSALNVFMGKVTGFNPARIGLEVIVDVGVKLAVLVSGESVSSLRLERGSTVWVSFKASAVRFISK